MSVRKLRNKWWVDFRFGEDRHRKKSPDNTRAGALAFEATLRARLAKGESLVALVPTPVVEITFADFAKEWFASYVLANNKPSEQRNKTTALTLYLLPILGRLPLCAITGREVDTVKAAMLAHGLKPKSVNNHLAVLRRCLASACEWGIINLIPRIKPLRSAPPPVSFLTDEEVDLLLADRIDILARRMIFVGLRTGMRFGEMCALTWENVDLGRGLITVAQSVVKGVVSTPKSGRSRHVPMTRDLIAELARLDRKGPLVLSLDGNSHLKEAHARKILRRACRRVGVRRIGWHVLRHTFATQLVSRGVPMRVVQRYLGHSTVVMTERYAHLAPDVLADAISVLEPSVIPRVWATGGQRSLVEAA